MEYQERFSAAGRIPHNAQRRELAPNSRETGTAQSVQCALEPLFAKGFAARCQACTYPLCLASMLSCHYLQKAMAWCYVAIASI